VTKTHIKKLSLSTYVWHFNETGPDNWPLYGFEWQMDYRFLNMSGNEVPFIFTRVNQQTITEPESKSQNQSRISFSRNKTPMF
jgi:hypothetical protein